MSEDGEVRQGCDRCGNEALGIIGDEALCESCIHGDSACCGRFPDIGTD